VSATSASPDRTMGGAPGPAGSGAPPDKQTPLGQVELDLIDAYWRAANYLSVGQIYLSDNPLLRRALVRDDIKARLLGHWGTCPGLNFIYAHLNRVIKSRDLNMIYVCGPGHGGPAMVANVYLEGTYSEYYPQVSQTEKGLQRLFKQFSFPGGIPSHVAAEIPAAGPNQRRPTCQTSSGVNPPTMRLTSIATSDDCPRRESIDHSTSEGKRGGA